MSIQTELTRITNAKTAIKAAIEGKGVTVPDGTLLDGMAALIESIEAGGGGGGSVKLAHGTLTFASDTTIAGLGGTHYVTHNLGVTPNFALIFVKSFSAKNDFICSYFNSIGISKYTDGGHNLAVGSVSGYNMQLLKTNVSQDRITGGTTDKLYIRGVNSDTIIRANIEVYWLCGYLGE